VKPVEQVLHVGVMVEIDIGVGIAVAREKFLDAQRPGAVIGTEEHHVAETARDQFHAPQDERAHDNFAQLGIGLHQRQQLLAVEFDHLAGLDRAQPQQRAPA
jgi:hypothetical protein